MELDEYDGMVREKLAGIEVIQYQPHQMIEVEMKKPSENTLTMFIDLKRCIGCFSCETSCKMEHDDPVGPRRIRVMQIGPVKLDDRIKTLYMPNQCMHCDPAPCVESCPNNAMRKRQDGIVYVDSEACIGCKRCMQACPYGAPQYDSRNGKVIKCDFCMHRVDYRKSYSKEELENIYRYSLKGGQEITVPEYDEFGNINREDYETENGRQVWKGRMVDEKGEPISGKKFAETGKGVETITYNGLWPACATKCSTEAMAFGYFKNMKKKLKLWEGKRNIVRAGNVFFGMPLKEEFPYPAIKKEE